MLIADCQKHYALKLQPVLAREKKLLISDGIFFSNRNPNYLGEMLLYGSFAGLVPDSHVPKVVLAVAWGVVFLSNMFTKEKSLKKKFGWSEYKKRSWMLLFRPNWFLGVEDDQPRLVNEKHK